MYDPWNLGGLNPSFFVIWGLNPPSPYVEPPLIPMTRNALSIEAVGRRANNVLLPHTIQAWDNDCWSEQLDQRQIPPSKLEQYCMGCWPGLISDRYLPQRLNSHQRHIPRGTSKSGWSIEPMAR